MSLAGMIDIPLRVFVDTSAYVALASKKDTYHTEALAIMKALTGGHAALLTTNFVIAETHATVLRYAGARVARFYLQEITTSEAVDIIRAEAMDEQKAKDIIYRYADKDFSLVDAISFAVMERLGISRVFAFDQHFAQYGFQTFQQ